MPPVRLLYLNPDGSTTEASWEWEDLIPDAMRLAEREEAPVIPLHPMDDSELRKIMNAPSPNPEWFTVIYGAPVGSTIVVDNVSMQLGVNGTPWHVFDGTRNIRLDKVAVEAPTGFRYAEALRFMAEQAATEEEVRVLRNAADLLCPFATYDDVVENRKAAEEAARQEEQDRELVTITVTRAQAREIGAEPGEGSSIMPPDPDLERLLAEEKEIERTRQEIDNLLSRITEGDFG